MRFAVLVSLCAVEPTKRQNYINRERKNLMKRILCLLLAAFMLLSLVACGSTVDDPVVTGTKENETVTEQVTDDPNYICDLPSDLDYGGETVGILYINLFNKGAELVSEELGLGVVSDAVFERNLLVEEQLGITYEYYPETIVTRVAEAQSLDIQSGLGDYDIVVNGTYLAVQPALEGKYINLSDLEYIDTSKHYWTQGYNDMVTFTNDNMQFLASGPMAISMFRFMYLTLYNKTLLESYQIPDLYDTVTNGEWTMDYQYSIIKDHYVDKDGDSKSSTGDFFGFITDSIILMDPYMVSCDVAMIVKDPDTREMQYNAGAISKLSDVVDKVQRLYNDESTYVYTPSDNGYDTVTTSHMMDHFAANNTLMATTLFLVMEGNYESLADMSYGIAPIPKFDTNQKEYRSYVQDQVSSFGISSVVSDPERQEMLAAVLEAMAYHSYNLVRPAYYEVTVSERYMQDPQSNEILKLIFASLQFDFSSSCSNIIPTLVIRDRLRPILIGESNTVSSATRSWERQVQKALDKYNDSLAELVSN